MCQGCVNAALRALGASKVAGCRRVPSPVPERWGGEKRRWPVARVALRRLLRWGLAGPLDPELCQRTWASLGQVSILPSELQAAWLFQFPELEALDGVGECSTEVPATGLGRRS